MNHTLVYRPDIDGLRAIAILSVVLYHAFPGLIPGGFVGVDIFFVISGYLITSILLKNLEAGRYSIKAFYARRIRRLFPALGLVLVFCLLLGWLVLTPEEYEWLGKHTSGGVGFIANFMFWKEAGYFDAAADTKPLLHLWSLGIEEQFYIVWPLSLYFVAKRKWNLLLVITVIALASFGLNVWRIGIDPTGTFYSPWTRSWELAIGALLAYQNVTPVKAVSEFLEKYASPVSLVGLVLLTIGFIFINDVRPFSGYWALLPCVGAAFLIAVSPAALINRAVLSGKLFVFFGLISFPLYLWHWPLLSFGRIIYSETPPIDVRCILVALSIFLAWLTYFFIEKPIRGSKANRKVIVILVITLFLIGITGHLISKTQGVPSRQFGLLNADPASLTMGADRKRLTNECGVALEDKKTFNSCWTDPKGSPCLAVWGDSKGEALFYGLARESDANASWMILGNMNPIMSGGKNGLRSQLAFSVLTENKNIEVVLLGTSRFLFAAFESDTAESLSRSARYEKNRTGISNTILALESSGKKVVFFIDHPIFPDPKSCISGGMTKSEFLNHFFYRKVNPRCSMTYEKYQIDSTRYLDFVTDLKKKHPQLFVYDPSPLLCDIPNNRCEIAKDGKFLYSYGDHLSDYANSLIARDLLPKISKFLKN